MSMDDVACVFGSPVAVRGAPGTGLAAEVSGDV